MVRHTALCLAGLLLAGCATTRMYHTPLSAAEGALAVPAIVSTAESMGLQAWGQGDRAQVRLADGTNLYWWPSGTSFLLSIGLASSGADLEVEYREAKVKADQIWDLAIQARQQNSVGAAVLINPGQTGGGSAVQVQGARGGAKPATSGATTGGAAGPAAGTPCRSGLDCGSGQFCKDHGGGKVCMGNGAAGAPCRSGIDCGSGLFCRSGICGG